MTSFSRLLLKACKQPASHKRRKKGVTAGKRNKKQAVWRGNGNFAERNGQAAESCSLGFKVDP